MQDLVLLGLLMEEPKHGYELKQKIDAHLGEIAPITSGTVYYTLRRLGRKGWVTERQERQGNRPERRVYEITAAGKAEFKKLLRESLFLDERPYYSFDVGLFFSSYIGLDVVEEAVNAKLQEMNRFGKKLAQVEKENPGRWPFHLYYIKERARLLLEGNETWYRRLKEKVRAKRLEKGRQD